MNTGILKLKNKRRAIKAALTRCEKSLPESDNAEEISKLKIKFETAKELLSQFNETQLEIELLDEAEFDTPDRSEFEERYFSYIANAKSKLDATNEPISSLTTCSVSNSCSAKESDVKLPVLALPKFSGKIDEWFEFFDAFQGLFHSNPELNNLKKFQYLQSCLSDEASTAIRALSITADNYPIAIDILKKRFENKKYVMKKQINGLISLPNISKKSVKSIRQLLDAANAHIEVLLKLDLPTNACAEAIIVQLITNKMDTELQLKWENVAKECPTFLEIESFLVKICETLETVNFDKPDLRNSTSKQNNYPKRIVNNLVNHTQNNFSCQVCKLQHGIYKCPTFLALSPEERLAKIKTLKTCANCLKPNHKTSQCFTSRCCSVCNKRHHTLLHLGMQNTAADVSEVISAVIANESSTSAQALITNNCTKVVHPEILLATAQVDAVEEPTNRRHNIRVLLDPASQSNLITRRVCKLLKLKPQSSSVPLIGVGKRVTLARGQTPVTIMSKVTNFKATITCHILETITNNLPLVSFDKNIIQIPSHLVLADPEFNISSEIDMLIGADLYYDLLLMNKIRLEPTKVCAIETVFGWTLGGPLSSHLHMNKLVTNVSLTTLDNNIKKFWEHENIDIISRGTNPVELLNSNIWWSGPSVLSSDINMKPQAFLAPESIPESKRINLSSSTCPNYILDLNRFSTLSKLTRVMAYVLRFIQYCKGNKPVIVPKIISILELRNSLIVIIKNIQVNEFSEDLSNLSHNLPVSKRSKLKSLDPFCDETGVIRVGGRLAHAQLSYDKKHPIVILSKNRLSTLILRHYHISHLHSGALSTLSASRDKFWIIGGRNLCRKIIHECVTCFRVNPQRIHQKMGDLPSYRVAPIRPFINSGVDYGGPFQVKESHGRGKKQRKVYIALFVCCSTKAIHIETVMDLTSEAFLAALKRFISRRGYVSKLISDNGTNFVGASNELKGFLNSKKFSHEIIEHLAGDQISWQFVPPRTPHFGGLWKAGIKSVKSHLKKVMGNSILTYDEFNTLVIYIKAILNSRPLTAISNDPNDLSCLTPGHFIIGDRFNTPVEPDLKQLKINRLSRWQHIEQIRQHFWRRWHREYLHQLHSRTKWVQPNAPDIKVGALVLLVDENSPPLKWQLGRIVNLHYGQDNVVRVVTVKTKMGIVQRGVTKICILPSEE